MKRTFTSSIRLLLVLASLTLPINSHALSSFEVDSLHFKLSDSDAFIMNTVTSSSAQIAEIYFKIKYDNTWSGTLQTLEIDVSFDSTKLQFFGADPTGAWVGATIDTSKVNAGRYDLQFTNGNVTTFPSTFTSYAKLKFKIKCQVELSVNSVLFVRTGNESQITLGGNNYLPDSDNWDDGTVTAKNFICDFTLRDSTFNNSCEKTVSIPVYETSNFKSYFIKHWIKHNEAKLEFIGLTDGGYNLNLSSDATKTDTTIVTAWKIGGIVELSNVPVYYLRFKLLDNIQNDTGKISFYADSSSVGPNLCTTYDIGETYSQASVITLTDSAVLKGTYIYPGNSLNKSDHGDSIVFHVMLKNTFLAGKANALNTDTGIFINVDSRKNLDIVGHSTLNAPVEISKQVTNDSLGSFYQVYDASGSNFLSVSNDFDTLLRIKMTFDTTSFAADWNDKYLHPKFRHTFTGTRGPTSIYDTVGCIVADSASGMLRYWGIGTFDSIPVDMGQFYTTGIVSTTPCTYNDLFLRATFSIDSFSLRVQVSSSNCIWDVTQEITGVSATQVDYRTWDIYSNSSWSTLGAADTLVKTCRLEEGLNGSCNPNTTYTMGLTFSSRKMWDTGGVLQFAGSAGGNGQAKCSGAGQGCANCAGGGGAKPGEEINLPTEFSLHQNFPNPFNPITTISFDLPLPADYVLSIYNLLGQEVQTYFGHGEPGKVSIDWDASIYSSGVYIYRLEAGSYVNQKKMLLIK